MFKSCSKYSTTLALGEASKMYIQKNLKFGTIVVSFL